MTLDENDYLTHQLYTASKTPRIKKARIKGWIFTTGAFLCLTFLFFESNNDFLGYYFLVASGLSLTLYPFYSRWRHRNHYLKYVRDTYKNRFGTESTLEINDNIIVAKDKTGEERINTSEIEEINEIRDFCFVKMTTGASLIISKAKADDIDKIKNQLRSLADNKGIKYNMELDWKWR
jgi:hypothetical protein